MSNKDNSFVEITLNKKKIETTERALSKSILQTADVIRGEVVQSKVIPFDTGTLQNSIHIGRESEIEAYIEQNTPYARRQYYNDGANFQTVNNSNAKARWYSDWEDQQGIDKATDILMQLIKQNSGGVVK